MYNKNNQINDKGGRRHEATVNIKLRFYYTPSYNLKLISTDQCLALRRCLFIVLYMK